MTEAHASRRLAAILAADVVGYTRLMQADEDATLKAWWRARNDIIDPSIARHGGRIVKHTGDGFLAEFPTATEAVRCAAAMQTALGEINVDVAKGRRFHFRMGINVGEIVDDDEDIYGDGVNIAARLESLAEPGGICLSAIAHEQVKNKLGLNFEYLGAKKVKHIAEPLHHYRVGLAGGESSRLLSAIQAGRRFLVRGIQQPLRLVAAAAIVIAIASFWPADEPSSSSRQLASPVIAVAPFRTIGGADSQLAFSEGLTEEVLTALSSTSGLRVMRSEAAVNQGPDLTSSTITYRFAGSVRWAGNKVRVSAQLVEAGSGIHLWGGRYDRNSDDVLKVQKDVATKIVSTLSDRVAYARNEQLTTSTGAIQALVYRGLENLGRLAEIATFLPQDIIEWVTGKGDSDTSVGDMKYRKPRWLVQNGYLE